MPPQEATIFKGNDAFKQPIPLQSPTMILVPMLVDSDPSIIAEQIQESNRTAEELVRGSTRATVPRLIFDSLLHLWGQLNEINASIVVVPKIFKDGNRSRIAAIVNKGQSVDLITLHPATLPPDSYAYCAYCGPTI